MAALITNNNVNSKISENGFHTTVQEIDDKLNKSIKVLNETFLNYSEKQIFLSFNGGKDCTVLLHMVKNLCKSVVGLKTDNLYVIYVQPEESFIEIENFVDSCEETYQIKINRKKGNLKKILETMCQQNPEINCCIMGNRRTDPYCGNLNEFQETDPGWPKLMRVNPLLDWTCENIWDYLLKNKISYCSLYDFGYTSIGDRTNTIPNPNLKYYDEKTKSYKYHHASKLTDDSLERAGRT